MMPLVRDDHMMKTPDIPTTSWETENSTRISGKEQPHGCNDDSGTLMIMAGEVALGQSTAAKKGEDCAASSQRPLSTTQYTLGLTRCPFVSCSTAHFEAIQNNYMCIDRCIDRDISIEYECFLLIDLLILRPF